MSPADEKNKSGESVESIAPLTPRLRRNNRWRHRIDIPTVFRIGMLSTMLVAIVILRKPCADGFALFYHRLDPQTPKSTSTEDTADANDPLNGYEVIPAQEYMRRYYPDAPPLDELPPLPAPLPKTSIQNL